MRLLISPPKHATGFSLIEVLVTVVVLSVGLLGLAGMQYQGSDSTSSAYYRSQATFIGNELAERMHANRPAVNNNEYAPINIADSQNFIDNYSNDLPNCDTNSTDTAESCDTSQLAAFDIHHAVLTINEHLPNGRLMTTCTDSDTLDVDECTDGSPHIISIFWDGIDNGQTISLSVIIGVSP